MLSRTTRRPVRRSGTPLAADIRRLLRQGSPSIMVQPILDLTTGRVAGYEALARFAGPPEAGPEEWFASAHRAGLGADLESAAIAAALAMGADRPAGTALSLNVSPSVLSSSQLATVLPGDLTGLQIEITEHELADDARALLAALDLLRARGARIAVDDVGQGYAGLTRVMGTRPDVLKLDRALVAGISADPAKIAMAEAVVHYAARTGARVCAEGLETVEDLVTAADLDIALAQGWIVGRPAAQFEPATTESRAACAAARAGGLRPPVTGSGSRDLAHLLAGLADAADLREAARRAATAAPLLSCQLVRLTVLRGDQLVSPADPPPRTLPVGVPTIGARPVVLPAAQALADLPAVRHALAERAIGQVIAGTARAGDGERVLLDASGAGSLLLVPLISAGRIVGVLECFGEHAWSRHQLRVARMVAAAAGPVVATLV